MSLKKCPFCAEEIQAAAIKCKHCGSMIGEVPPELARQHALSADSASERASTRSAAEAIRGPDKPLQSAVGSEQRRVLYSGYPSWRAYFAAYAATVIVGVAAPVAAPLAARALGVSTLGIVLSSAVSLAIAVGVFFIIGLYRRSRVVRISTTNIETEYGILSKKIDVLELWRCRDVRYKQSLSDRILGIAHIEIYTADVTTPQLEVVGLPASRQLFEKIRDSIEIQRHSRNVVGFVQ